MRSAVVSPSSGPLRFGSDEGDGPVEYVKPRPGHLGLHPGPSEIYKGWRTARILCFLGVVNIACHFVLLLDLLKNNCLYSVGSVEETEGVVTFQSSQTLRPWSVGVLATVFGDGDEHALTSLWYFGRITFENATDVTTSADGLDVDTTVARAGQRSWQLYTALFPPQSAGKVTLHVEKRVRYLGEIFLPKLPWDAYFQCLTPQPGFVPLAWSPCVLVVGLSYNSLPYPAIIVGDVGAGTVTALLCDSSAFPKVFVRATYEATSSLRLKCQSFLFHRPGASQDNSSCPAVTRSDSVTCMTIQSCTNYVQGPLAAYIAWIIVFLAAWMATEPYLCAVGQRCFSRFNLNTHYLRYRTAHFWIANVLLDLPVCMVAAYLAMQRSGGSPTIVTYVVVTALGVNTIANGVDVCIATWNDDPKKHEVEEAFSADVWRGEIELRDSKFDGDDAKSTATGT